MQKLKIKLNNLNDVKNFIKTTTMYENDVDIIKGHYTMDGKSLMAVMALDISQPFYISINNDDDYIKNFELWRCE